MRNEFPARALNVVTFAANSESYAGSEPLAQFERLMAEAQRLGGQAPVAYSVQGHMRPNAAGLEEPWLNLAANVNLSLVCQRCLGPVEIAISFARDFRFVPTEELAAAEDDTSEEDVLVVSKSFDLLALVEDELLMSIPLVPKHEECPVSVKLAAVDADFVEVPQNRVNPFAVLHGLKK